MINGREANREAMRISAETRDWVFVRKPDFRVEYYEVITGRKNSKPGDRGYYCGKAMPW